MDGVGVGPTGKPRMGQVRGVAVQACWERGSLFTESIQASRSSFLFASP